MKGIKALKKYVYLAPLIFIVACYIMIGIDTYRAEKGLVVSDVVEQVDDIIVNMGNRFNTYTDDNKPLQVLYYAVENINYNIGLYTWQYWHEFTIIETYEISMLLIFTCLDIILVPFKWLSKWVGGEC